jgi:type I restriction enzyme S subunit
VRAAQYGAAQEQINVGHIVDFVVPVPDLTTQDRVTKLIREEESEALKLLRSLDRQISLLQEHRTALITAAVTGELEISGAGK